MVPRLAEMNDGPSPTQQTNGHIDGSIPSTSKSCIVDVQYVRTVGESVGVDSMTAAALTCASSNIMYVLQHVIANAGRFAFHSRRTHLSSTDIDSALQLDRKQTTSSANCSNTDVTQDDAARLMNALKGVRKTEQINVKTTTTHTLSLEQQVFFKDVTEAIMGNDDEKRTVSILLNSCIFMTYLCFLFRKRCTLFKWMQVYNRSLHDYQLQSLKVTFKILIFTITIRSVVVPKTPILHQRVKAASQDRENIGDRAAADKMNKLTTKVLIDYVLTQRPSNLKDLNDYRMQFGGFGDAVYRHFVNAYVIVLFYFFRSVVSDVSHQTSISTPQRVMKTVTLAPQVHSVFMQLSPRLPMSNSQVRPNAGGPPSTIIPQGQLRPVVRQQTTYITQQPSRVQPRYTTVRRTVVPGSLQVAPRPPNSAPQ
uniref:Transcription initiation factor TFIID subunit 6 n=1 Tax=Heterorhabditis bacteriophora TaxID=37862 RepID=A0A1I7XFR5_HETBA